MQPPPTTLREWLHEHPPPDSAFTQSAAGVAARVNAGEDFRTAVKELLDEVALLQTDDQRERAIAEPPPPTGDARQDAYLGALAEHLALAASLPRPAWTVEPDRFLDRFWFVTSEQGFRPLALVESPAVFRRRGIFVSSASLQRC